MKTSLALLILIMFLSAAACGDDGNGGTDQTSTPPASVSPTTSADPWAEMRSRPLMLPAFDQGSACSITGSGTVSNAFAPASGDGPVYPVLGDGEFPLGVGEVEGGWEYVKVLWVSDATYTGPVLIRGGQMDGEGELRFQDGPDPPKTLELPEEGWATSPGMEPGWRAWPSYTRIQKAGCYAYQIDGTDFTDYVVFEAAPGES